MRVLKVMVTCGLALAAFQASVAQADPNAKTVSPVVARMKNPCYKVYGKSFATWTDFELLKDGSVRKIRDYARVGDGLNGVYEEIPGTPAESIDNFDGRGFKSLDDFVFRRNVCAIQGQSYVRDAREKAKREALEEDTKRAEAAAKAALEDLDAVSSGQGSGGISVDVGDAAAAYLAYKYLTSRPADTSRSFSPTGSGSARTTTTTRSGAADSGSRSMSSSSSARSSSSGGRRR